MSTGSYIRTQEHRQKMSEAKKREHLSAETLQKMSIAKKGKRLSEEHRKKLSESMRGNIPWNKGMKRSMKTRAKISDALRGRYVAEESPHWQGGISGNRKSENNGIPPYKMEMLRAEVRKRDNYTCQMCGITENKLNKKLHTHHIDYDPKNNRLDNLITLCTTCHIQTNFNRQWWIDYFLEI